MKRPPAAAVPTMLMAAVLLVSLGLLIGLIAAGAGGSARPAGRTQQFHLSGQDLTNPLLACEGAEETIGDRLLRPFRDELLVKVDRLVRDGSIFQAAVYFRDLYNGPWHGINEKEGFYPASLLKIPAAMALLKQAERDPALLERKVRNTLTEDLNEGMMFRPARRAEPGRTYTLGELMDIMVAESDNNAAELVRRKLDMDVVARTFEDLGVPLPAGEVRDYLNVRSFASFFRILFNASYLTKDDSERLLAALSRSSFGRGIAGGVPRNILVANKYGEQVMGARGEIKELHDCGIVYYPDSPYVLCVMTKGPGFEGNAAAIREISRTVFSIVDANQQSFRQSRDALRPPNLP